MKKTPSHTRARRSSQSFKHKKYNRLIPAELNCLVYLPGVGSVVDYEWFETEAEPPVAPVSKIVPPHEVERLCVDPNALREFCAKHQRIADANKPAPVPEFADFSGALSGGAR